jgi:hypothetical protein
VPLLAAASSTAHSVVVLGEAALARHFAPNVEDKELITRLFALVLGVDADGVPCAGAKTQM